MKNVHCHYCFKVSKTYHLNIIDHNMYYIVVSAVSSVVLGAAPPVPTKPDNCVVKSADVAFIVDASGSVDAKEWKQVSIFDLILSFYYVVKWKQIRTRSYG